MRVELIYAPGCSSYKKARNTLETVIAEEGLPVPVELVEEHSQIHGEPTLRINGNVVHASPVSQHMEHFRDAINRQWQETNLAQLLKMS
ncbi:MAG TPA: hypothetical protein V6C81_17435 [Planktothrix sp.]|jgi:hypothetical protein